MKHMAIHEKPAEPQAYRHYAKQQTLPGALSSLDALEAASAPPAT